MNRDRLIIFFLLFATFSFGGVFVANLIKERLESEKIEEVRGLKNIPSSPRVINLPPIKVLVADEYRFTPQIIDSDTPVEQISIAIINGPTWISLADRSFVGRPSALDIGTHQIEYTVSDGENISRYSFYVVVTTDE